MGVINSSMETQHKLHRIIEELKELNEKVDALIAQSAYEVREAVNGTFVLKSAANMIWWTKDEKAARYRIKLFAGANGEGWDEIDVIEVGRERAYWVFNDLPKGIRFKVEVIAENRNGEPLGSASINI